MAIDGTKEPTRAELLEDLRKQNTDLRRAEVDKKNAISSYNDEIKAYKGRIKDILAQLNNTPS